MKISEMGDKMLGHDLPRIDAWQGEIKWCWPSFLRSEIASPGEITSFKCTVEVDGKKRGTQRKSWTVKTLTGTGVETEIDMIESFHLAGTVMEEREHIKLEKT